jgi:predicted N-acetyltransferase YhbS
MINIRKEETSDYFAVESLHREAFWNLYEPGAVEHVIVHNMRSHPAFIPELALVLLQNDTIVGSIFYTHAHIVRPCGNLACLVLAPVAIAPSLQRTGLGRALIDHSMHLAQQLGHGAIILQGYRHHYTCYGFVGAKKYGIGMEDGQFYAGLLAKELVAGALADAAGYVQMPDIFEVDAADVAVCEANFPIKIKAHQPSQDIFAAAVTQLDSQDYSDIL